MQDDGRQAVLDDHASDRVATGTQNRWWKIKAFSAFVWHKVERITIRTSDLKA